MIRRLMHSIGLRSTAARADDVAELRAVLNENVQTQKATGSAAIQVTLTAGDVSARLRGAINSINRRTRESTEIRATINDVLDRVQ